MQKTELELWNFKEITKPKEKNLELKKQEREREVYMLIEIVSIFSEGVHHGRRRRRRRRVSGHGDDGPGALRCALLNNCPCNFGNK